MYEGRARPARTAKNIFDSPAEYTLLRADDLVRLGEGLEIIRALPGEHNDSGVVTRLPNPLPSPRVSHVSAFATEPVILRSASSRQYATAPRPECAG
jgi:hypothetical protein